MMIMHSWNSINPNTSIDNFKVDHAIKNITKRGMPSVELYQKYKSLLALVIGFCLILAGCDTKQISDSLPELTFKHTKVIQLNVQEIEIINEFKMPFKHPNIEHLVPISPGASAERWASDILKPVGTSGTAQFVITNGSIIQENLKIQKGIKGVFSIDQSKRFNATVDVRIEIFKDQEKKAEARTSASRSQTLREGASPNTQSQLWYTLVEKLMQNFDREMRKQIKKHLVNYAN